MKRKSVLVACLLAGVAAVPAARGMQTPSGFMAESDAVDGMAVASAVDSSDAQPYAEGTRAIHDGKWADAVRIFGQVAELRGEHTAAALYWKAYAQNKMGQSAKALETCVTLQMQFGKNSWSEDCGALEIEIHASKGHPMQPQPGQSDELKLLTLAALMQKDPKGARAQIEDLVHSDSSERLKEGALFLLGESVPELRYPQIVRISRLEGDVRIARASTNEKSHHEEWETAERNLPLETGDSLVSGADGRAEIEFENASTVYLAPNSVLAFDDLHTTSGVPHSEIELLSGTATIHLDSLMPGEAFFLRTPTNDLLTRYPQRSDLRVSSYTDGLAVATLKSGTLSVPGGGKEAMTPGKTLFFTKQHVLAPSPEKAGDFAEFDAWVADRYEARNEAMAAAMKEAGLTTPVPGMADMKGQGRFYPCEPYGTCWEPNGGSGNSLLADGPAQTPAPKSAPAKAPGTYPSAHDFFPCLPSAMYGNSPYGQSVVFDPWYWTVCHAGWWVNRNNRYVWVAGTKMHHHPPVHWFRFGKTVAFVPLHPKDVKGQPPLNREYGFAATHEKGVGYRVNPIKFVPTNPVGLMKAPPREFRNERPPALGRAEAPHMEMHALRDVVTARAGMTPVAGVPLRFDHQTGGFSAPHQVAQGGHSTTVFAPVGHMASSAGGRSGGGSFGGSSAARAGGGGNSGGGWSGGGGTGGMVSAGSSISVSSGASASSTMTGGGGSHQ